MKRVRIILILVLVALTAVSVSAKSAVVEEKSPERFEHKFEEVDEDGPDEENTRRSFGLNSQSSFGSLSQDSDGSSDRSPSSKNRGRYLDKMPKLTGMKDGRKMREIVEAPGLVLSSYGTDFEILGQGSTPETKSVHYRYVAPDKEGSYIAIEADNYTLETYTEEKVGFKTVKGERETETTDKNLNHTKVTETDDLEAEWFNDSDQDLRRIKSKVSADPFSLDDRVIPEQADIYRIDNDPGANVHVKIRADSSIKFITLDPAGAFAEYNSGFSAPYCSEGVSPCRVNESLIISKDNIGTSEPNSPNTIDSATDGTSGTYNTDESIDAVNITDLDAPVFSAGHTVEVSVRAHCWDSGPTDDVINIIYANDTSNPAWTVEDSNTCQNAGFNTFTHRFTLSGSNNVSIRALIDYNGVSTDTFQDSDYGDQDDVVIPLDNSPPEIQLNEPENRSIFNSGKLLNFSINDGEDNLNTTYYSRNGGPNQSFSSDSYNIDTSGWSEQTHIIEVWSNDSAGNVNSQRYVFTIDDTSPSLSLFSPENKIYEERNIDLNYTASDQNLDTVFYSVDGEDNKTLSGNTTIRSTEGENYLVLYANDSAGNINSEDVYFTLDPIISIYSPLNITITDSTPDLEVEASRSITEWKYNVDTGSNITFTPNTTLSDLSDSPHNVTVWGELDDGGWESALRFFAVDTKPPEYRNLRDSVEGEFIETGESVNISLETRDLSSGVYKAILSTNESGTWKNYTSRYESPNLLGNVTDKWLPVNYTWSKPIDQVLGYKVWISDEIGQWSVTDTKSFWVEQIVRELFTEVEENNEWNEGSFNATSADRSDNSGNLGLGYLNGTGTGSLVGMWRLDRESSSLVKDYSGYGNDGDKRNFEGDESGAEGILSTNSYDLDGTDDFVSVPQDSSIAVEGDMTVSTWVNFDVTGEYMGAVSKLVFDGGNYNGWGIVKNPDGNENFRFYTASGGNISSVTSDSGYTDTGQWHHVVGVRRDGTTYLYIDGVEQAETDTQAITDTGSALTIGRQYQDDSASRFWNGKIDEVRLYDRALSASEIKELYFYGGDGKFEGTWNNTYKLGDREVPDKLMVNSTNVDGDTGAGFKLSTNNGENEVLQLDSGDTERNYSIPFDLPGGNINVETNLSTTQITKSPIERNIQLWVTHYPKSSEPTVTQPLEEGMTAEIRVRHKDEDLNLENSIINISDNNGDLEVQNGKMKLEREQGDENVYSYSYKIADEPSNVGTWTVNVTAEDSQGYDDWNSTTFTVQQADPPNWRKQFQEKDTVDVSGTNELRAEGYDEINLSKAVLATNETGVWENRSDYDSPKYPDTQNSWTWTNFSWQNPEIEQKTVAWKIWYGDSGDNWNSTDNKSFYVSGEDTVPPDIDILAPENRSYNSERVDLNVKASEDITEWRYNLDDGSNSSFTPNITLSGLSEGRHNLTVWAEDTSGNWNSSIRYFTVDTVKPRWRNLQDNVSNNARSGPVNISVELRDDNTGVYTAKLSTDTGEGWQNHTSEHSSPERLGNLTGKWVTADFSWKDENVDGSVDYRVWVQDEAGNWNLTTESKFRIDRIIAFKDIDTQGEWLEGNFNMTSADRSDNSGNLGLGYLNGTTEQSWSPERKQTGFWRMDRNSGQVPDYSGNDISASPVNYEGDERGVEGVQSTNSHELDGADDYLDSGVSADSFISSDSGAVSVWIKPGSSQGSGTNVYDKPSIVSDSQAWFGLMIDGSSIYAYNYDSDADNVSTSYIPGEWTHLVWVHEGGTLYGYKDGELFGSTASGNTDTGISSNNLLIGHNDFAGNYFNGKVDEVQIFNQGLSSSEVEDLYFHQRDSKFRGYYNTTFDLGNDQRPVNISVDYRNQDSSGNVTYFNASTTKGEEKTFQVSPGSGSENYDLGFSKVGGNINVGINMTALDPRKTPIVDGFTLYTDRESAPEPANPKLEYPVEAGMEGNITVNVSDNENNVDTVLVNLTDSQGNQEVIDGKMSESPEGGKEYWYQFSTNDESADIGEWDIDVWANDTSGLSGQNSSKITIQQPGAPRWRNQRQENDTITGGGTNNLSAQGIDEINLEYAVLATNETGIWENKTDSYGSPKILDTTDTWTFSNFSWQNSSLSSTTVGWKIWYNDSAGNYNSTNIKTFDVGGVEGVLKGTLEDPIEGATLAQNRTFTANVSVECNEADCGDVTAKLRYNQSGSQAGTSVSETPDKPFYTVGSNLKQCGTLSRGENCSVQWDVNATGEENSYHKLDVLMDGTKTNENDTEDNTVKIDVVLLLDVDYTKLDFPTGSPGTVVDAPNNSDGYKLSMSSNSNDANGGVWMRQTNLTIQSNEPGGTASNTEIRPENTTWSMKSTCSYSGSKPLQRDYNKIVDELGAGNSIEQCFWQEIPYGKHDGNYQGSLTIKVNTTN